MEVPKDAADEIKQAKGKVFEMCSDPYWCVARCLDFRLGGSQWLEAMNSMYNERHGIVRRLGKGLGGVVWGTPQLLESRCDGAEGVVHIQLCMKA